MRSQNGYRVTRDTTAVTAVQGYTFKSAYHIVVGEERRMKTVARKRGSSRLQIARRSVELPSSSLPTAPRSLALPNNRSPLTSDHLEPPSTAYPYTGTAFSNRPSCEEPAIYRYTQGVEYSPVPLSSEKRCSLIQPLQLA